MTGKQLLAGVAVAIFVAAWLDSQPSRQVPAHVSAQPASELPAQVAPIEVLEFTPAGRRQPSRYFHGYLCTDDCSGHEAGYEWAKDTGIEDPDDCDGNSESFIEGCRAAAEEASTDRQ